MKDIVSGVATAQVRGWPSAVANPASRGQEVAVPGNPPPISEVSRASQEAGDNRQAIEDVRRAVEDINDHFQSVGRDLQFKVDKESGRTIITVLDSETKEVVRQIPPEEVLNLAERLHLGTPVDTTGIAEKV